MCPLFPLPRYSPAMTAWLRGKILVSQNQVQRIISKYAEAIVALARTRLFFGPLPTAWRWRRTGGSPLNAAAPGLGSIRLRDIDRANPRKSGNAFEAAFRGLLQRLLMPSATYVAKGPILLSSRRLKSVLEPIWLAAFGRFIMLCRMHDPLILRRG